MAVVAFLLGVTAHTTQAIDRYELGKTLRLIPPNGPPERYGNVVLRLPKEKGKMPPITFPHWSHRSRYACRVCHQELGFSIHAGETMLSRGAILGGKYCGACHNGRVAFPVWDEEPRFCHRCHDYDGKAAAERFRRMAKVLPGSDYGNHIDWTAALEAGRIAPLSSLSPDAPLPVTLPENLLRPLELGTTAPRSGVLFYHEDHQELLDCSTCHPEIFNIEKRGTEFFTMEKNIYGWFCGTCHMRIAFPMDDCRRCHPQMRNRSGY